MRTAKQWSEQMPTFVDSNEQCIPMIERIQLEAYRAGMAESAELLIARSEETSVPAAKSFYGQAAAILAVAAQTAQLP